MKRINFLLIITVLFFSCKKETPEIEKPSLGMNSMSYTPPVVDAEWYTSNKKLLCLKEWML